MWEVRSGVGDVRYSVVITIGRIRKGRTMDETRAETDAATQDAHDPEDRRKALFPEDVLTLLAMLCVLGGVITGIVGLVTRTVEVIAPVIGLLVAAFQIAVLKVVISALFDIREYLARLNERGQR